eukprot:gene7531-8966_t
MHSHSPGASTSGPTRIVNSIHSAAPPAFAPTHALQSDVGAAASGRTQLDSASEPASSAAAAVDLPRRRLDDLRGVIGTAPLSGAADTEHQQQEWEGGGCGPPCPLDCVVDSAGFLHGLHAIKTAALAGGDEAPPAAPDPRQHQFSDGAVVLLQNQLAKCQEKLKKKESRLEEKTLLLKRCNPVSPTDFTALPPSSPGGSFFHLDASQAAAAGWVDQESPACAASVVAGAVNAVLVNLQPKAVRLKQADVLQVDLPLADTLTNQRHAVLTTARPCVRQRHSLGIGGCGRAEPRILPQRSDGCLSLLARTASPDGCQVYTRMWTADVELCRANLRAELGGGALDLSPLEDVLASVSTELSNEAWRKKAADSNEGCSKEEGVDGEEDEEEEGAQAQPGVRDEVGPGRGRGGRKDAEWRANREITLQALRLVLSRMAPQQTQAVFARLRDLAYSPQLDVVRAPADTAPDTEAAGFCCCA